MTGEKKEGYKPSEGQQVNYDLGFTITPDIYKKYFNAFKDEEGKPLTHKDAVSFFYDNPELLIAYNVHCLTIQVNRMVNLLGNALAPKIHIPPIGRPR